MADMTNRERSELEELRWRLDQMCDRRLLGPLSTWETDLFDELVERESQLARFARLEAPTAA